VQKVAETLGNYTPGHVLDRNHFKFSGQSRGLCHVLLWDAYQRLKIMGSVGDPVDWHKILDTMLEAIKKDRLSIKDGEKQSYSHLLDVSYASYCTKRLAEELGRSEEAAVLAPYLPMWREAFDPASGLMREAEYYEAGPVSYSFRLLHDMDSRIALSGGPAGFAAQLDSFFGYGKDPIKQLGEPPWEPARSEGMNSGRFDGVNNEVTLETPYAYHYVGLPDKTAEVVTGVMKYHFSDNPGGLPGNDDSGGLSSWYVWNAIGLFPVPGQGIFFVGSPLFTRINLAAGAGKFSIEVNKPSEEAIYLETVELNGAGLQRTFLRYDEVLNGGSLRVSLTDRRGSFTPEELPPSDRTP
jgi:putative alpha-1,2-mannosidase